MIDSPTTICDQVRWLLLKTIQTGNLAASPAALDDHIATCATCRGTLAVLAAEIITLPPAQALADCAACQTDLAAYIDYERAQDTHATALAYSQVWWHMWICPACAETYRLTTALAEATQAGTIMATEIIG